MRATARNVTFLAAAMLLGGAATGAERDIHIPSGRSVGFNWYLNDGAGFRWDISANGQVSDGSNDAYDGGMQLRLGGTYFSSSSSGRLSKDGREVEIGPWKHGSVNVYRRVYIDGKLGYCRWIDIFENGSGAAQTLSIQYYSNLGGSITSLYTSSGKTVWTDKDWGVVTASSGTSSRPGIVHIFASKGANVRPSFRYTRNSDSVYYTFSLKVPTRKTVALCLFQAQRRPLSSAQSFLKNFKTRRELTKVPAGLRRIIVNMGGATLTLGSIDLPRHEQHDLAVLRNENELLGKILNERFDVETFYGKLELAAANVVGVNVPAPDDPHVQVVLTDGQVVAGKLLNAPLRIRLTNGSEMSLPPSKLSAATFALSPEKPGEIKMSRPTVTLRSGQQLAFRREDLDGTYQTQYGTVKLDGDDLRQIHFDTPEGGLHRAIFRNGSILSGLLAADDLKLTLDLGPTLAVRRHLAARFVLPATEIENTDLAELTLRNDDRLFGHIAEEALTVTTQYGRVTVKPSEVAELTIPEQAALGQVRFKLHNGTTVTGKFVGDTIHFQIAPGPKLPIFLGHVLHITCPRAGAPPAAAGAKASPNDPSTQPASAVPVVPEGSAPRRGTAPPPRPPATVVPAPPAEAPRRRAAAPPPPAAAGSEKLAALAALHRELRARQAKLQAELKALQKKGDKVARAVNAKQLAEIAARINALRAEIDKTTKELAVRAKLMVRD